MKRQLTIDLNQPREEAANNTYRGIIGAVIGDIVGSSREGKPVSRDGYKLFTKESTITDDTVLTAAIADWLLNCDNTSAEKSLRKWGKLYPSAGYGSSFKRFLASDEGTSLNSTHNGAVMRVSPVGYLATSIEECMQLALESALPSHNSPSAIRAAQANAVAIFMAREGASKQEICNYIEELFSYNLNTPYEVLRSEIRSARANRDEATREANHERIVGAETTIQDALVAFRAGRSYEDVIRKAILLGGDADTDAAIAGSIAAAYYGVPEEIIREALIYIPSDILDIINKVDGTSWQASKLIPPKSNRWSCNDVAVYGSDEYDTMGEHAYYLTHPTRFRKRVNNGYPIIIFGDDIPTIEEQAYLLQRKCSSSKETRWHLHDIGIESGRLSRERYQELFSWALEMDNVLVSPTLLNL
jgi:ADP-ribosylglycohydrolase